MDQDSKVRDPSIGTEHPGLALMDLGTVTKVLSIAQMDLGRGTEVPGSTSINSGPSVGDLALLPRA